MKKLKAVWARAAPVITAGLKAVWAQFCIYFDDLLVLGAGICFISAANGWGGRSAALAVAGIWLAVCAVLVARANGTGKGGKRK